MKTIVSKSAVRRLAPRGVALTAAMLALAACNLNGQVNPMEGIGFRDARFEEISAAREYRSCIGDAIELDEQARASGNTGRYLASAQLLEKCEAQMGPEMSGVNEDERIRAYALSVQNYLKGGDIEHAANNFEKYQEAFPGKDLYFADGSSFIQTMKLLLGQKAAPSYGQFAALNVNDELKAEMRRVRYWKRN
jgi:hypothetical protein